MAPPIPDVLHCCRRCLRHLVLPKRVFSSTPTRRKHGAVPSFQPTQSPDLNALLDKFRTNIFVPAHLIRLQKQLVYKRSNWHLLTNVDEPATVRMGNEVHQLRPIDRTLDEPPTRKSFLRILELMQESGDWRNLPGFLEGLKSAKRKVDGAMLQKLARKANEAGQMGIVLDCVRRVEGTGFNLSDLGVAREVMLGATTRAVQGEWSEEAVNKATQYAESIWEEMWDMKHAKIGEGSLSPRTQPEVIGILVQMHAAKVILIGAGEEEVGLVQKYVALMLKNWERAKLHEAKFMVENGDRVGANNILILWSPTWHAMQIARKALGEETPLAKTMGDILENDLEPLLQNSRLLLEKESRSGSARRRGLVLFEKLSNALSS